MLGFNTGCGLAGASTARRTISGFMPSRTPVSHSPFELRSRLFLYLRGDPVPLCPDPGERGAHCVCPVPRLDRISARPGHWLENAVIGGFNVAKMLLARSHAIRWSGPASCSGFRFSSYTL